MSSTSTTSTTNTFPLLSLPRELRNAIFALVLVTPADLPDISLVELHIDSSKRRHSLYPADPFTHSTPSLLLCNKQIHIEVQETIRWLVKTNQLMYHLGCEVVRERELYPRWLSIPCYATHIPHVHATFRQSGASRYSQSGWQAGNGGPGRMIWRFYGLLKAFIQYGPDLASKKRIRVPMSIGTLTLDIVTPNSLKTGEKFLDGNGGYMALGTWRTKDFGVPPAVALANELRRYFHHLLKDNNTVKLDSRELTISRVETVVLSVDGVEQTTWNVGKLLEASSEAD